MIERPEAGAPRVAWHLYVFERVAPILAARDAEFAGLIEREQAMVSWIRREIDTPGSMPAAVSGGVQTAFAELVAKAQATYDVIAFSGKGDEALLRAVHAAFAPHSLFARGSRWWWKHGVDMMISAEGSPYFAPSGDDAERWCEPMYHQEWNRRRIAPEVLAEARGRSLDDIDRIQRAAGIGLFQSGPDDSECAETDTAGITDAAGIGLFQASVPSVPEKPAE